ncbi:dihydrofolate reductase [Streptomyces sp. NRRL B-24572]|uniref:dihydrofolate reductase n=1 Tax=Streptomyces sp. NRRL B-24572 TaxID=1962156 RepID=UPI000A3933C4|nr:dihydrofolate reductase [Streptomyces sp. NRRL B-24572]
MSTRTNIGLIWAQTPDGVIGVDNTIPWRLPEDMAHFKATTLGHPVIMGRKTWDSLPARFRPLVGRRNIVVTRDAQWTAEGAERAGSVEAALALAAGSTGAAGDPAAGAPEPAAEVLAWVMGGGEIYRATLPHARTLSVTEVDTPVVGDTYAPSLDADWRIAEDTGWRDSTTGLRYRIRRYTRP